MTVFLAVLATIVVVLLVLNLTAPQKAVEKPIEHFCEAGDPHFVRLLGTLLGPGILQGNTVTALHNGDQIFPAMLEAITSARQTITFETYIYWSGSIGEAFAEALIERARAGVRVHVVLDAVGTGKLDDAMLDRMKASGIRLERYHPVRWYTLGRLNNRTHRKLLVIDGCVGFTGGVGIADVWTGDAQDPEHWRDSHYRIEGPAVGQMQAAFMDNWIETTGEVLHGDAYFPALRAAGAHAAQVFQSSITDGSESVRLMYLLSIASAAQRVRIGNAYFVPDNLSVDTLIAAQQRGAQVEIIVPGRHTDAVVVRHASRARWGPLLEAGVKIYEYQDTMYHNKIMVVDDVWTSVGSTNFDSRSFRLNDEANLNVLDGEFAAEQSKVLDEDRARSRQVTLAMWQGRPVGEKAKEWLAGLLRLQL